MSNDKQLLKMSKRIFMHQVIILVVVIILMVFIIHSFMQSDIHSKQIAKLYEYHVEDFFNPYATRLPQSRTDQSGGSQPGLTTWGNPIGYITKKINNQHQEFVLYDTNSNIIMCNNRNDILDKDYNTAQKLNTYKITAINYILIMYNIWMTNF